MYVVIYINHSHPDYDFFEGPTNLWLSSGNEKRFLTSIIASNNNEVLLPFGSIIQDLIDDDLNVDDEIILTLDGIYDNRSRIIFHREGEYSPRLEIFYTK